MSKKIIKAYLTASVVITSLAFFMPVYAAPKQEEEEQVIEEPEVILPTLNAAVSEKSLTVNAQSINGIKAIYVNGYKFENSGSGNLKIKLTQFDAGYEKFYIFAEDNAGLSSEVYELGNPYFDTDTSDDKDPSKELPVSVDPSDPSTAEAVVTEHFMDSGREFYTIETESGKEFYLIVDCFKDEEKVYFLTPISEEDLLNVTSDNSNKLPRNSAVAEGAIPDKEKVIVNNNADEFTVETVFGPKEEETPVEEPNSIKKMLSNQTVIYAGLGGVCLLIIIIVVLSKNKKKNKKTDELDLPVEADEEDTEETEDTDEI